MSLSAIVDNHLIDVLTHLPISSVFCLWCVSKQFKEWYRREQSLIMLRCVSKKHTHFNTTNFTLKRLMKLTSFPTSEELGFKPYLFKYFGKLYCNYSSESEDIENAMMGVVSTLGNIKQISYLSAENKSYILTSDGKITVVHVERSEQDEELEVVFRTLNLVHKIVHISSDFDLLLMATEEGFVYEYNVSKSMTFELKPDVIDIVQVSVSNTYRLMLDKYGKVWIFGKGIPHGPNFNYRCLPGFPDILESDEPICVPGLSDVVKIVSGYQFSLILTNNGAVYGLGCNMYGQMKVNLQEYLSVPTLIIESDVVDIFCGIYHSIILDENGCVTKFGVMSDVVSDTTLYCESVGIDYCRPINVPETDYIKCLSTKAKFVTSDCNHLSLVVERSNLFETNIIIDDDDLVERCYIDMVLGK